jgi:hypothetical protein
MADTSLKTVMAFKNGNLVFDLIKRTATFGKLPPVAVPDGVTLEDGAVLNFQLVAPDGSLRKQTRSGVLRANEKQPGILRIAGMSKTARKFPAEDGWGYAIYKYRAYFSHPGLKTDGGLPEWLKGSIVRQKALWNRMAWLCREARRDCSPVPINEIIDFVQNTILPEIDEFNNALGRSKEKIKHPAKLKTEMPGLDGLWRFAGELRKRIEKGRAVPAGLLDRVVEFAQQFRTDYTPYNKFIANFTAIAEREAKVLKLRQFEVRPTVNTFKTVLDCRRVNKAPWSEGWPLIKYPDAPKSANWGLHYYFHKAGVDSAFLESRKGLPGLTFGPPIKPSDTGHHALTGVAARRAMREAEISIPGENREHWNFRFGVLQHRPLPDASHVKEWKLIFQDNALWLCFVVELQRPIPAPGPLAAGLDVGWRRTKEGICFGTLYEPATKTFRELIIDLQESPNDHKDWAPFRINLGPSRWEKRNITQLMPDWKPGDPIPSTFETRAALQGRRNYCTNAAKVLLRKHLGERMPTWLDNAGRRGLLKLDDEFRDDTTAHDILSTWRQEDERLGKLVRLYLGRSTKRLEYGHAQVAHDACRHLLQKGVNRLIVETSFLAKTSQNQDYEDHVSLKRSQKYRQFAAIGKFMAVLKNTAVKYGITVNMHEAINTTRICQYCNRLNPSTEKEQFICDNCGRLIRQGQNAAVNLSRFGCDPELAEMALHAGRVRSSNLRNPQTN